MSYHRIIIAGNLGRDPEMRYTPSGQAVTSFSVATSRKWTGGDGQQQEETIWWRVSVWGRMAETCNQYLSKGSAVLVEGRMQPDRTTGEPRIWTDQNGNARSNYEITAENVRFLSTGGNQGGGNYNNNQGQGGGYQNQGGYQQAQQPPQQQYQQPPQQQYQQPAQPVSAPPMDDGIQEDEIPF